MKLALLPLLVLLGACAASAGKLQGAFLSSDHDEMGVIVFRADGTFGYKFASKHTFYSEDSLPPNRGRYRVLPDGRVEVFGLARGEPGFSLKLTDGGRALVLTRSGFPPTATYRRQ